MEVNMKYSMMSDENIVHDIAESIDSVRIQKRLKDTDIESAGGISRQLISDFRNGKRSISLRSFIRILRGINELNRLQDLFHETHEYSPLSSPESELPRRVRNKRTKGRFEWGDEN